jgi:isopentenyldiphosphate isomerase
MESEILDIFDERMKPLGCCPRGEVHKRGYWHQTFHCWIVEKHQDGDLILFQKRAAQKKNFPNTYDVTAAGHLLAGEDIEEGVREIEEELGINVDLNDLQHAGVLRDEYEEPGVITDREFCHVYILVSKRPLHDYHFQEEEVSGLVKARIFDAIDFFSKRRTFMTVCGVEADENGKLVEVRKHLHEQDFAPHKEEYVLSVLNYAMKFLGTH